MRPLLRHVSRPVVESFIAPVPFAPRISALKIRSNHDVRPSVCLQCRLRRHTRPYSDNKKPSPFATPKDDGSTNIPASVSAKESTIVTTSPPQFANLPPISSNGTPHAQRQALPSQEEERRSRVLKHFSHVMDNLQSNIFIAGKRLNDLTGYSGIETMKKEIEEQEELVRTTRAALRAAKESYSAAIAQRSASQREVNELLQRKHAWSAADLERFTSLYRSDHANEQAETAAQEALTGAERRAEEEAAKLSKSILARYHEEQIWSDKIRRMSTWGTWGLMGVNVLLFLVFQIGVEPWRRRRLVKGFEEKVMEALERDGNGGGVKVLQHTGDGPTASSLVASTATAEPTIETHEPTPDIPPAVAAAATAELESDIPATETILYSSDAQTTTDPPPQDPPKSTTSHPISSPLSSTFESYKSAFSDLFSDRTVTITQRNLTNVALEGAAAGMAVVGILVVLLGPR